LTATAYTGGFTAQVGWLGVRMVAVWHWSTFIGWAKWTLAP